MSHMPNLKQKWKNPFAYAAHLLAVVLLTEDDQIILLGLLFYIGYLMSEQAQHMPMWRTDGIIITALIHIGPVEFLYYWLHRALHDHFPYSRYHSHHHSSIVTEPNTAVIHPFVEVIAYAMLFFIPLVITLFTGTASVVSFGAYFTYIDFMNYMGHCNFELNSDTLYEQSLERKAELPDVVHLTHLTTPESIYHLRLGFSSLASKPHTSKWYFWLMWPVTLWSFLVTDLWSHICCREKFVQQLKIQTWTIPRYSIQYFMQRQRDAINKLIEEAIMEADQKGIRVLSLGLLNQDEQLNRNGELYLRRHPQLKVKVIDGSSLAVAVVLNSVPKGTSQVVLRGRLSKVAKNIALALCEGGIQVIMLDGEEYKRLEARLSTEVATNLVPSKSYASKVQRGKENPSLLLPRHLFYGLLIWLVGDGLTQDEQMKAPKGTLFIPYSQFPPRKVRKDCFYFNTPAIITPKHLENVYSCENWLPRRVMSAWRIAGILHALEGWNEHECGDMMLDTERVWKASLTHGFCPLTKISVA
ncbi:hypothetical protein P3S67_004325 [Capsicum chacoense]